MKKVLLVICLFVFLVGCSGNKDYIKQVDIENSPLQYNYEIHNDYETMIIKIYEVKNKKWSFVEKQSYKQNEMKDMLGIAFDNNEEISVYIGDYIKNTAQVYTYKTKMENYSDGTVASRDRINIENGEESPFLAYWSYYENSQYEVTTHSDTLDKDFLDHKVKSDGGFLITLTFQ